MNKIRQFQIRFYLESILITFFCNQIIKISAIQASFTIIRKGPFYSYFLYSE